MRARRLVSRLRARRPKARLDAQGAATARLSQELEAARADAASIEGRLSQAQDKLAHLDLDAIGRAQSKAEDALLRATNAHGLADDALSRAGRVQALGEDTQALASVGLETAQEALLPARIAAFGAWLELCPRPDGPLISVILPTRDRPALLPRAVASVLEQLYYRWQLIVVDDGEQHDAGAALGDVEGEQVELVQGPRRGLGAARNAGLDSATGDVVCYLDDDNVMHPAWLQAVAHVFAARSDFDVLYGVTLAEHRAPDTPIDDGWWPSFWQLPWSRETLLEQNIADAGALAHRRDLPEARFDETLKTGEDWDLLIRLTADRPALAVPALSHAYTHDGGDRMSRGPAHRDGLDEIRRRYSGE